MDGSGIEWVGVAIASVAWFVLGAVWYGALSKPWMAAVGKTREEIEASGGGGAIYAMQFVAQAIVVIALAYLISLTRADSIVDAVQVAVTAALVAVFASSGDFLYEGRNRSLFLINSGYRFVGIVLAGGIIGAFL